jgi:hypothetical protein
VHHCRGLCQAADCASDAELIWAAIELAAKLSNRSRGRIADCLVLDHALAKKGYRGHLGFLS